MTGRIRKGEGEKKERKCKGRGGRNKMKL
jgi:hypothetical protein